VKKFAVHIASDERERGGPNHRRDLMEERAGIIFVALLAIREHEPQ